LTYFTFSSDGIQLHAEAKSQIEFQNSISNVMDKMKITQSISIATPGAVMSLCQFMACFSTCQYSSLVTNIFGLPTSINIVLFVVHFWKAIQMIKTL
jgi:hypothetical protein